MLGALAMGRNGLGIALPPVLIKAWGEHWQV